MTDYSKPIGWWCPGCNGEGPNFAVCCGVHSVPRYAVIPEGEREEIDAELCPEIGTIEGDAHTTEFAAAHDKGFCLYADSLGRYRLAWPDNSDQPLDGWVRFVATGKRGKKARS